jgi:uncharacterized protein (TIGR02996 family)
VEVKDKGLKAGRRLYDSKENMDWTNAMHDHAFLEAILAAPEDDALRLVYADWLEDRGGPGDAARAEFIRTQMELASLADDDPRRPPLKDREHEFLAEHERRWLGDWPSYVPHWRFERGLLTEIETSTGTLVEAGADLFARHPITRLVLEPEDAYVPGPVEEVGAAPWLARLVSLRLLKWNMSVGETEPVLASPHLTGLTELDASDAADGGYFPSVLARCPSLARLRLVGAPGGPGDPAAMVEVLESTAVEDLDASGAFVNDDALGALLRGRFAGRLVRLCAAHGAFGPDGWRAFASPTLTGSLHRLDIAQSLLAGAGLGLLFALPGLRNLTALKLSSQTAPAEGLGGAIAYSPFWANAVALEAEDVPLPRPALELLCRTGHTGLKKLDLLGAGISRVASHLWSAPFADALTDLGLGRCGLDDEDLARLAASGRCARLRSLDLRAQGGAGITDAGALRLAAAPSLGRLRSLNLYNSRLTARGVDALLNGGPWRLAELGLGHCGLTPEAVAVLAASPALARLRALTLSFNEALEDEALLPLAESPHLSPLCELNTGRVGARAREALKARLGHRARSWSW